MSLPSSSEPPTGESVLLWVLSCSLFPSLDSSVQALSSETFWLSSSTSLVVLSDGSVLQALSFELPYRTSSEQVPAS
jgi:hypothetical protein